ncbi:MAG: response regulator, partial [Verrucomicrobiaceae bacterium]
VLVVEDQSSQRKLMIEALQRAGYTTFQAGDIQQALLVLHQHKPDVVVADMHLPSGDGGEVIREVRKLPGSPALESVDTDCPDNRSHNRPAPAEGNPDDSFQ